MKGLIEEWLESLKTGLDKMEFALNSNLQMNRYFKAGFHEGLDIAYQLVRRTMLGIEAEANETTIDPCLYCKYVHEDGSCDPPETGTGIRCAHFSEKLGHAFENFKSNEEEV